MSKAALLKKAPGRTFESLYERHAADVYRYCQAMLGRQADAEDATQTTFLNAYRALERGETPRDPRSWLQAIALNVCREHYRSAGRRPEEVSLDDDPGELVQEPAGPELGDVVRGLSCLPFTQRAALVMREFEGRSLAEIAVALEVSVSAVEALLFRARRALREQLEEKLSCREAEYAISRQLDGALPRRERGRLRAHLRECADCASLARRVRAQRSAIRSLAFLPLPASLRLSKLFGGGAASASASASAGVPAGGSMFATATASVAAKVAAVAVAGAVAVGVGYQDLHIRAAHAAPAKPAAVVHSRATSTTPALTRPRPPRPRTVVVAGTARRSETRRTSSGTLAATVRRSRATSAASTAAAGSSHPTTSTIATTDASSGSSSGSSSAGTTSQGNGNAHHGNPKAAATTPASRGNEKASKSNGTGNAYGRSKAGTKPAPATQNGNANGNANGHGNGNGNGPPATPPGQLKSHGNNGNGKG